MGQPGGEPPTTTEQHLRRPDNGERTNRNSLVMVVRGLVVLVAEVGGRWSPETTEFLCSLAKARAQSEPLLFRGRAQAAWLPRWSAILAQTISVQTCLCLHGAGAFCDLVVFFCRGFVCSSLLFPTDPSRWWQRAIRGPRPQSGSWPRAQHTHLGSEEGRYTAPLLLH